MVIPGRHPPLSLGVGQKVLGRWKGGPYCFPGVIAEKDGDRIHIHYDDGDREWTTIRSVRIAAAHVPAWWALSGASVRTPPPASPTASTAQPIPPAPPARPKEHEAELATKDGPSGRSSAGKMIWIAAILVLAATAGLWMRERSASAARNAAFADVKGATAKLDDAAARSAIERFDASRPWLGADGRQDAVRKVEKDLDVWPDLKKRNTAYADLQAAAAKVDDDDMVRAANEFLETGISAKDPRAKQVERIRAELRDRQKRRARDLAYDQLIAEKGDGDNVKLLHAAEAFLEADEPTQQDPRVGQVRTEYSKAFSVWFVGSKSGDDNQAQAHIDRYRKFFAIK